MWLTVEHVTRFAYDAPINEAYTELRLKPLTATASAARPSRSSPSRAARRSTSTATASATPCTTSTCSSPREPLVTARSEVWTPEVFVDAEGRRSRRSTAGTTSRQTRYVDARRTRCASSRRPRRSPGDAVEARLGADARRAQADDVRAGTTNVHTTADEALAAGRGVCQDFAHVMIAACRVRGIPARYVSGYLYDPRANGGEGASHAWVDVHVADTAGSRSTRRTTASRPSATSASASAATTPTSRRRAASTRAGRRRRRGRGHDPRALSGLEQRGQARSSAVQPAARSPSAPRSASPISFEIARTSTAGHARERRGTEDAEALHRLDERAL